MGSKISSRGLAIRFCLVAMIMCDTIRRMVEGTRPIDWILLVIEIAVLAVIAIEYGERKYKETRRGKRLAAILVQLSKGQEIQSQAPPAGTTDESIATAWIERVEAWNADTLKLLAGYSSQAATAFVHESGGPSLTYRGVTGTAQARNWYSGLQSRLNNLQSIMEKPEVYF
jgi:hypothetical protein